VRPLQVERRLIADGYRFSSPSFDNPHEHEPVTGGCC
jgi:hypothetical protein